MRKLTAALVVLIVPTFLLGCASMVKLGQTREAMDDRGATRWVMTEYDWSSSRFVWIPHWVEGIARISTAKASNCKNLDVLEFKDGVLVRVEKLGTNRDKWAAKLKEHGRIKPVGQDNTLGDPMYDAVALKILHIGAPIEAVFFAGGFPLYGWQYNPSCHRDPYEIRRDSDVLYYLKTSGGSAQEVVIKDGRVAEIRPAKALSKDWQTFYHPIKWGY